MSGGIDAVKVAYRSADIPHRDPYRALPEGTPPHAVWINALDGVGFFLVTVMAVQLVWEHDPRGVLLVLGGALVYGAAWLQRRRLQAHVLAASATALHRTGPRTIVLDREGLSLTSNGYRSQVDWPTITGVIVADGCTLLLTSPVEFIPIPDASLPPDLSPDTFRARITRWRAKAPA